MASSWDRLIDATANAEGLTLDNDAWLVVADALEDVGERRLARNLRALVYQFRRLMAIEGRPYRAATRAAIQRAYRRFYPLQRDVFDRLYELVSEDLLVRYGSPAALGRTAGVGVTSASRRVIVDARARPRTRQP